MTLTEKLITSVLYIGGTTLFTALSVTGYLKQDMGALVLGNVCLIILIGGCTPADIKATKTSYRYLRQSIKRNL